jgi:hypothetical protein
VAALREHGEVVAAPVLPSPAALPKRPRRCSPGSRRRGCGWST